jgi:isoquinoline 1-oxidoreductase beta subunit
MRVDLAKLHVFDFSRREFLKGAAATAGAFVLGAHVSFPKETFAQDAVPQGIFDPNVFLNIGADNSVTFISKHFEMGQGVTTGLATLVAEELGADWSTVRYEFAPNNARISQNLVYAPSW